MISVYINGRVTKCTRTRFPDGAVEYRLDDEMPTPIRLVHYVVSPQINVNEVITELAVVDSIFTNCAPAEKSLYLPYLPYARADRKFHSNGSDGLSTFLKLLSTFSFNHITVCDPHNPKAIPSHFQTRSQLVCFRDVLPRIDMGQFDSVVSPDAGAATKAANLADSFKLPLVVCAKHRDSDTGKLSDPQIADGDVVGKRLIIVDDICDGGYTFIQLADLLYAQGAKSVDLYVTHLIASKGLTVFNGRINRIFYYQIIGNFITRDTVVNFNKGAL